MQLQAEPFSTQIDAERAILINAETGRVLFEKRAFEKAYPASLTKIATALYALEQNLSLEEEVTAHASCLKVMSKSKKIEKDYRIKPYLLEPDGSHFWLRRGEKLSLYDLLCGVMVKSANDAANVVAFHAGGGSIEAFMGGMNHYLKTLGCKDTHFVNPHGLHYPTHSTTAYDMAQIVKKAMSNPDMMSLASIKKYYRPKTKMQGKQVVYSSNRLMLKGPFFYEKALGMKSGYIENAQYTLAAIAQDDSRTLIAVVLGCSSTQARYRDVIKLFDMAFAEERVNRLVFNKSDALFSTKPRGAKKRVDAQLVSNVFLNYFPSERQNFEVKVHWNNAALPIEKDQDVGYVELYEIESGAVIHREPFYAMDRVVSTLSFKIKRALAHPFESSFSRLLWLSIISAAVAVYLLRRRRPKPFR